MTDFAAVRGLAQRTLQEVAAQVGTTKTALHNFEHGTRDPELETKLDAFWKHWFEANKGKLLPTRRRLMAMALGRQG